jgi:signal transduction histidine kinase
LKKIKPKIYYALAMIYRAALDTKMSVIFLDSSIISAKRIKDYVSLSNAYNALGNLKFNLLDTLDAKVMYDSAYNIAQRNVLPKQTGISMASLSRFEQDSISCSEMRKKAIEILRKQPGNEEEIALILINLGTRSSNTDTAIKYYLSSIKFAQSGNFDEVEIAAYNNLAYSFIDKKNFIEAERSLVNHAIPIAEKFENYDWLSTLYDSYTDVLTAEKKIDKALLYARKALKTRIKADKKRAADQVRLLSALLDVKNREVRIQIDEKEIQVKENKIQLVIFWFSISFLIVLLVLFLMLWKLQRIKIIYQKEQIESAKKLIESEENMKNRVSMELHSLVSPFYISVSQQIEKARINDSNIVKDLKERITNMTENIRQISHRMSISFIEELTISELVTDLCENLKEISNIPIHCLIENKDFHLSSEETIHAYRIAQELLTNALKYVTFGEISIRLFEEEGRFYMLYKDTGGGFDVRTNSKKGLGIINICERAKIINGKAVLITEPGKGTKWNIIIPLKQINSRKNWFVSRG